MANYEHLNILKQGVEHWNEWRRNNKHIRPDLSEADLRGSILVSADLSGADFSEARLWDVTLREANLQGANLYRAALFEADLSRADLSLAQLSGAQLTEAILDDANLYRATLSDVNLREAYLRHADLREANFFGANLMNATLTDADLRGAYLRGTVLIETDLTRANLSGAYIFGVSAWKLKLDEAIQTNLIVTDDEPVITVDNLEVAQFIYLLIHNEKLRDVLDTVGKKVVLILGRFTEERKAVLDALRDELRRRNYIPILFDFEKPVSRDLTETVVTLAHLSRFVIADLTDPSALPHELMSFVRDLPSVAVQPLTLKGQRVYGMFENIQRYPWVLPIYEYETQEQLIAELPERIIKPAEAKVEEIRPKPYVR
jgi:uncharacterized protein YjbI with pentapeptide repeats